jgi:phytanoyl-CoA hydroxylase
VETEVKFRLSDSDRAAIDHYRAHGWARLGTTISEEKLIGLRQRAEEIMLGKVSHPGLFFQLDAATGNYQELAKGKGFQGPSLRYRKIEKLEHDPRFRELIDTERFGQIAHHVLGEIVTLYRAVLFSKSAEGGTHLPWHQDAGTFWGLTKDPQLQIWTALDDAPEDSGCVEVVPDSHLGCIATPLGGVIPDYVTSPANAEARSLKLPARAGESLLIHNYCWHRSGINTTGKPRRALTVCLMDGETKCRRKKGPRQFTRLYASPKAGEL